MAAWEIFFVCAQFLTFSLIINGKVGSFTSHCFPKLRKNFPLLRMVRSKIKSSCMHLPTILLNFHSSYDGIRKQAKESFMIVRFWGHDRKLLGLWLLGMSLALLFCREYWTKLPWSRRVSRRRSGEAQPWRIGWCRKCDFCKWRHGTVGQRKSPAFLVRGFCIKLKNGD